MDVQSAISHYKSLINELEWLGPCMGWTVITPHRDILPLEEVVARLGLDPTSAYTSGTGIFGEVSLGQINSSTMLFEANAISYVGQPSVLGAISENAEVWHVSWTGTAQKKLRVARDGEIIVEIPDFDYKMARGPRVDIISLEMGLLRQVARRRWPTLSATAMAIIEKRTGAHLNKEWLSTPQYTVSVDTL
ncbi:hypothetical protein [Streptosporangium sp. NPDC006930]|uniref:hypothetical protein n=1 Tax=Streptosporangium sp. NPDC006930 TaxID=3154783 RepID=UPI0034462D0F